MKIVSVVGARPNFVKIIPFVRALREYTNPSTKLHSSVEHLLVHTGQHYDDRMSRAFFSELGIPDADVNLGIGSGSHAEQVGRTMIAFEAVVRAERPDWIVVLGDVNAACACSITAKKENIRLAHIESGLRSRDMSMPEEVNRLVTDRLSDLLFTPDRMASQNLRDEGVAEKRIKFVGNIMIDTLEYERERAKQVVIQDLFHRNMIECSSADRLPNVCQNNFVVVTLHRPSNVDDCNVITPIVEFLIKGVASEFPVVWPIHPRTRKQLEVFGLWQRIVEQKDIILLHPVGYHDMLKLNMEARVVLTDSGGIQEECCVLGTPCLTLRWNTERPITLDENGGVSTLVGNDLSRIRSAYHNARQSARRPVRPELWDGRTAERIVGELVG